MKEEKKKKNSDEKFSTVSYETEPAYLYFLVTFLQLSRA